MARKTDGEKIDELERMVATLVERSAQARIELNDVRDAVGDLSDIIRGEVKGLTTTVAEMKTAIAVLIREAAELRNEHAEMKRQQEEASKKRWSLLPPIISAALSGIISALVAYFVANK